MVSSPLRPRESFLPPSHPFKKIFGCVFRLPDSIFRVQPSPREELFWSGPAHKSFAIGEVAANARAHCFPLLQFGSYSAVSVGAHFGASAYINTRWRMYAVKEMEVEGYLTPLPVRCNFTLWLMWMSLDWTRDKRWNLGFEDGTCWC